MLLNSLRGSFFPIAQVSGLRRAWVLFLFVGILVGVRWDFDLLPFGISLMFISF